MPQPTIPITTPLMPFYKGPMAQQGTTPSGPYPSSPVYASKLEYGPTPNQNPIGTTDMITGQYTSISPQQGAVAGASTNNIQQGGETGGNGGSQPATDYGPAAQTGGGDQMIERQDDILAQRQAMLDRIREQKTGSIEDQFGLAQEQFASARETVDREAGLQEQQLRAQQEESLEGAGLTLSRLKEDLQSMRGKTGQEAEVAKAQLRKATAETTRQARIRARALGASASSDFLNIMAAIENQALSGQGEIQGNLLDAMQYYDQQAVRADQDYSQFRQNIERDVTQSVAELQEWRRQQIEEIGNREDMSRIEKESLIQEVNNAAEASVIEAMSDYSNQVTAIEQWRAEMEQRAQQAAASIAANKEPTNLETARAQAADMIAGGASATEVKQVIGTAYGADIADQALQGYYATGGSTPEQEGRIGAAERVLEVPREEFQRIEVSPYQPPATEKFLTGVQNIASSLAPSALTNAYGTVGSIYGPAGTYAGRQLGRYLGRQIQERR